MTSIVTPIRTVGDLQKALSDYDDSLILKVVIGDQAIDEFTDNNLCLGHRLGEDDDAQPDDTASIRERRVGGTAGNRRWAGGGRCR